MRNKIKEDMVPQDLSSVHQKLVGKPGSSQISMTSTPQTTKTVTTTTTQILTTKIPAPAVLNNNKSSASRMYPLADSETPVYLRNFAFDHKNGKTWFREQRVPHSQDSEEEDDIASLVPKSSKKSASNLEDNDSDSLCRLPAKRVCPQQDIASEQFESDTDSDDLVLLSPSTPLNNGHGNLSKKKKIKTEGTASTTRRTTTTTVTTVDILPTGPKFMDVSGMIAAYEEMPPEMKRYLLFNLMQRSDRSTLSIVSGLILPALRCDFLTLLPPELSFNLLSYLDCKSLLRASAVSRSWKRYVDASDSIWRDLLIQDGFYRADELPEVMESERSKNMSRGYGGGPTPVHTPNNLDSADHFTDGLLLFRNVYRRKHIIKRNWMDPNSTPKRISMPGHGTDVVTSLLFDGERIITGSDDNTINVYDIDSGKLITTLKGHTGGVWALQYVGDNTLVSGSTDRSVRVWDISQGRCTHVFEGHTSTVRCLDILVPVEVTDRNGNVSIQPQFPMIVTGSRDSTLRVWRLPEEDDPEFTLDDDREADSFFLKTLTGHTHNVRAISGHGNTVVSGAYDGSVRVWDIEEGICRWELLGHTNRVYGAVIDAKRNRCISGSMDWRVKVWCLETGTLLYTLDGHTSLVGLLDLNSTLVSAAADSTLRVWNPENGQLLHELVGHKGAITCFQHDEHKVVSGSEHTLKLWDIKSGKLVRDLLDNLTSIWQVRFDDSRCIVAVKRGDETRIEVFDFDYDPYQACNELDDVEMADVRPHSPSPIL